MESVLPCVCDGLIVKAGYAPLPQIIKSVGMGFTVVPITVEVKCYERMVPSGDKFKLETAYTVEYDNVVYTFQSSVGFAPDDIEEASNFTIESCGDPFLDNACTKPNLDFYRCRGVSCKAYQLQERISSLLL